MTEQNDYAFHEIMKGEIKYAAMLFRSPAWTAIRDAVNAEYIKNQTTPGEEGKKLCNQKYIDLKCIEMPHLGQNYHARVLIGKDQEKPIRFYFRKGWYPEIEVDGPLIAAVGIPKIIEQLDTLYQLQSELRMT